MDMSPELDAEQATYYQSQIGILCWLCEIGRIDILENVSMLASHLALPREGHLEAVYHIYSYLRNKHNARMCFDPTYPEIDMGSFKECDWKTFYRNMKEAIRRIRLRSEERKFTCVCMLILTTLEKK